MSDTQKRILNLFKDNGYKFVQSIDGEIVDELYATDLKVMENFNFSSGETQKIISTRVVRYKNEYHDEDSRLIQLTIMSDITGLKDVKQLIEEFINEYFDEQKEIVLRPAYIYQVVPAIEAGVDDTRFIAGGMVRPEILNKFGLNIEKKSIYTIVIAIDKLDKLNVQS